MTRTSSGPKTPTMRICPLSRGGDFASRFWAKVDKSGDCWEWQGARFPSGYGCVSTSHGKHKFSQRAHRAAWQLTRGPIPDGLFVCHHCDNRPCVRPDHLFLGTTRDNFADMRRKNRSAHGSRNVKAKLAEADIPVIRTLFEDGKSNKEIALMYGVTDGAIWFIRHGLHWQRVA